MAWAQFTVVKATRLNFINLHMIEAQPGSLCDPEFWVFNPTQLILQTCHSSIQAFLPDGHFRIKRKEGEHMDGKTESCQRAGCRERPGDFAFSWGRKNIKRERSASKHHFHNCPVSRPWWAKGSEKRHNLSVGWTAKAHLLFLLTPPEALFFSPPALLFFLPLHPYFYPHLLPFEACKRILLSKLGQQ